LTGCHEIPTIASRNLPANRSTTCLDPTFRRYRDKVSSLLYSAGRGILALFLFSRGLVFDFGEFILFMFQTVLVLFVATGVFAIVTLPIPPVRAPARNLR
jgi:hypothetical protein